jgi:hypothetical protein
MEIRSSLWHGTPSSGPQGGAHRRLSAHRRPARARVLRGILVLALALGTLGVVAAAAMGHGGNVHSHGKVAISHPWMW